MASQHQEKAPRASFITRRRTWLVFAAIAAVGLAVWLYTAIKFPPDTSPEGAYLRIAYAMNDGRPESCFAYLEEEAQHAAFSIGDYAKRIDGLIVEGYPENERKAARQPYQALTSVDRGPGVWVALAEKRGWLARLQRDLSGIDHIETADNRATVITVQGTRYTFRKRPNGIWGLTTFTAELMAETEKLARDEDEVKRAVRDFKRAAP